MTNKTKEDVHSVRLIDGGVGTEIQRRGIELHPCYWSSLAHITDPDTVRAIHIDYLKAGATVVSANSFMAGRHMLVRGGINDFEHVNTSAVEIALQAREQFGQSDILVAGTLSIIPPMDQADDIPRGKQIDANYRAQAEILVAAGVDVLLAEMLLDSDQSARMLEACCSTGVPVWAGVSASVNSDDPSQLMAFRPAGKLTKLPQETLAELLNTVSAFPLAALGVMHTQIGLMPAALEQLTKVWDGTRIAYAQTGSFAEYDWRFDGIAEPEGYANAVTEWIKDFDLGIVGGCCGTRPDHIVAIRKRLNTLAEKINH